MYCLLVCVTDVKHFTSQFLFGSVGDSLLIESALCALNRYFMGGIDR
jgi:hypothetical protein